jgi:hypothetical protein
MPALPLLDESANNWYVKPSGGATAGASAGRYSTPGLVFDGVDDYHLIANDSAFLFGSGMFTVEADVAVTGTFGGGGGEYCILSVWGLDLSWFFGINGNRGVTFYTSSNGGSGDFSKASANNTFPASGAGYAHVAACRDAGNVLRLFIEGAQVFSATDSSSYYPASVSLGVGIYSSLAGLMLAASMDNVRITKGVARYTSAFTPPGSLPVGGADPHWANVSLLLKGGTRSINYRTPGAALKVLPPTAPEPAHFRASQLERRFRDVYFGGNGRVSGTTKIKGSPDFPTSRKVALFHEKTRRVVQEQLSDPVTGVYSFDYVDPTQRYTVVAFDHLHNFRAVIADNLTPGPMT